MRWVRAIVDTEPRLGVLAGDRVQVLAGSTSLIELLAAGQLAEAGQHTLAHPETVLDLDDVHLFAPIENPLRSATGGPVRQPLAVRATRQYNQDS